MFLNIAIQKLNSLIQRKDFIGILCADSSNITMLFKGNTCNVSSYGNVTWNDEKVNNCGNRVGTQRNI